MTDVSGCEFVYLDLVIVRAKERGVPKDSLVVYFDAVRLAALGSGVQCAWLLLAPWVRCVAYLT